MRVVVEALSGRGRSGTLNLRLRLWLEVQHGQGNSAAATSTSARTRPQDEVDDAHIPRESLQPYPPPSPRGCCKAQNRRVLMEATSRVSVELVASFASTGSASGSGPDRVTGAVRLGAGGGRFWCELLGGRSPPDGEGMRRPEEEALCLRVVASAVRAKTRADQSCCLGSRSRRLC